MKKCMLGAVVVGLLSISSMGMAMEQKKTSTNLSDKQAAELRQAVTDYKKGKLPSKQEEIINRYRNKYPNDPLVKAKLNEKARFDNPNMAQEKQEKTVKNQPQTQLSSQEVAELRKAVEQYKKNISKSMQEAIINKYKTKYPNDPFVTSKLNEKARFDNPNRDPLDEFPFIKIANAKNELEQAYAILGFVMGYEVPPFELPRVYKSLNVKWNIAARNARSEADREYALNVLRIIENAYNKVEKNEEKLNEEARQAKTQNQTDEQPMFQGRNLLDEFPGAKNAKRELDRAYVIFGFPQEEKDRSAITQSDVTKAYRKLSLKWHPDRWSSASADEREYATEVFKVINNAYEAINKAYEKLNKQQ